MFESIKNLTESLQEGDFTNARNAKTSRKILQLLKVEAQKARVAIIKELKTAAKPIKAFTKEQQLGKKEIKLPTIGLGIEE